jgi:hypothetical protein
MRIMSPVARVAASCAVSLFLGLAPGHFARADDFTSMTHEDAKDLLPPSYAPPSPVCAPALPPQDPVSAISYNCFLPMPYWARGVAVPPLPAALTPAGRTVVLTTPPVPAPEPLAPPKDTKEMTPVVVVAKPTVVNPTPAPAPSPALIAVSPFLDWIKANPQAAADQARQQAATYQAGSETNAASATPPANNGGAPGTAPAPYWMPPLIDSAPFGSNPTSGSSAAIYTTPQR